MKKSTFIPAFVTLLASLAGGCTLWCLPEGEPPTGTIVTNATPADYSLPGAVNRMATGLIAKAAQNGCSGVPVGVQGDLIALPVWKQAAQMLNWKRGEPDSTWQLKSTQEQNTWQLQLLRDGETVWQDRVLLRDEK